MSRLINTEKIIQLEHKLGHRVQVGNYNEF